MGRYLELAQKALISSDPCGSVGPASAARCLCAGRTAGTKDLGGKGEKEGNFANLSNIGKFGNIGCLIEEEGASATVQSGPNRVPLSLPCKDPSHALVQDTSTLAAVRVAIDNTTLVGLDIETTGLDPRSDRVRLLSLATDTIDAGRFTYIVDCFAVDPSPLYDVLEEKELILHNAAFDLGFLRALGFVAGAVHDTLLMAQLLVAGTGERCTLADCCRRYLGHGLNKSMQQSNWGGQLTPEQISYAAADAEVVVPLYQVLRNRTQRAGLGRVLAVEERCLPAVVWMASHGVAVDRGAWDAAARRADEEAKARRDDLDLQAPHRPNTLPVEDGPSRVWNWNSPPQVKQALSLAHCPVQSTDDSALASACHPLAEALRHYRGAAKLASSYGASWLRHLAEDGRVYPRWRQMGAASGRMSCSDPNMQQLPRGAYRRCVAAPPGRTYVKADYSQIELRIAAKMSGDQAMLEAYRRREDLHTLTARRVLGAREVTKEQRQLAKALNFGLLYGMGAGGFQKYAKTRYGVDLSDQEAKRYRSAFFAAYPGLAAWHRTVGRSQGRALETRTITGRRRLGVCRYTEKLNTPVQGTGADGLKLALALLWERRQEVPGAFPVLAVHDEIVMECDEGQVGRVADWLRTAMLDAMTPLLDPVPVEVEVNACRTWAGD